MSLPSSEPEGRPLVGKVFLAIMALVFAGVAAALHPDALGLRTWIQPEDPPDAVSLSYLELELQRRPEDRALRRALTRQLRRAGRVDGAAEVGGPLLVGEDVTRDDWTLVIELSIARMRAAVGAERAAREAELIGLAERGLDAELTPSARAGLARAAHEAGAPGLAARYVDRSDSDPADRLERAARLYAEADQLGLAADRWRALAELELAGGVRPGPLSRAVAALEAAGWVADTVDILDRWLALRPRARAALDPAIRMAWAAGRLDRAFELSTRRIEPAAIDPAALRDHVELALARGQPGAGLAAARRLVRARPGDRSARVLLARVAEWGGRGEEALRTWWGLAQAGDRLAAVEAERLARGLGNQRILLALISKRLETGRGDPDLIEQMVFLSESLGEPERAHAVLEAASRRPGADKRLWARLARLEARMGWLERAALRWQQIDRDFATETEEAIEAVELMWRVYGPERALEAIRGRGLAEPDVAELIAELAWQVGDRALAIDAHRALAELGRLKPYRAVRLLSVLQAEGRLDEALEVAGQSLTRHGDMQVLLRGLELALRGDRPQEGLRLLRISPSAERQARDLPSYWRLRSRLAIEQGDRAGAIRALERVIRLDPGSRRAQADLLWSLIELDDRGGLQRWTRIIGAGAESAPELWGVMAAALVHLGQDSEALPWYALRAARGAEDWRFWLDYAGALERVGRGDAALRARRYALGRVPSTSRIGRIEAGWGLLSPVSITLEARRHLAASPETEPDPRLGAGQTLLGLGEPERAAAAIAAVPDPPAGAIGRRRALHAARLGIALAQQDRASVARLVSTAPSGSSRALLAEGHALLGRPDRAYALVSRVPNLDLATRQARLRYLVAETRRHPEEVHGRVRYDRLGGLDRFGADVIGRVFDGDWGGAMKAGYGGFDDRPGRGVGRPVDGEARLALELERRGRRTRWAVELGGHVQMGGTSIPQVQVHMNHVVREGLEVSARATAFEVVPETPLLYTLAARDRLGVGVSARLPERFSVGAAVDLEHHHDRAGATLGVGGLGDVQIARDFRLSSIDRLRTYAGSRIALRSAVDAFGPELAALTTAGVSPSGLLPTEFATAGVGAALTRGDLDGAVPNPTLALRYRLGAWVGWQWPLDEPAYRVEAGLGTRVFGPDELYLSGYLGNVLGGLEDVQAGLQAGYRWRL